YPQTAYRSTGASTDTPLARYFLTVTAAGLPGVDVPVDGGDEGVAVATFVAGPIVKPSACNRSTVLPPMPFTRLLNSAASLNGPCASRSSRMAFAFAGPMPLMPR